MKTRLAAEEGTQTSVLLHSDNLILVCKLKGIEFEVVNLEQRNNDQGAIPKDIEDQSQISNLKSIVPKGWDCLEKESYLSIR